LKEEKSFLKTELINFTRVSQFGTKVGKFGWKHLFGKWKKFFNIILLTNMLSERDDKRKKKRGDKQETNKIRFATNKKLLNSYIVFVLAFCSSNSFYR
jgi:hypothetical protein